MIQVCIVQSSLFHILGLNKRSLLSPHVCHKTADRQKDSSSTQPRSSLFLLYCHFYQIPTIMPRLIQIGLRNQRRSRPHNGHIPSLCQLRNNFFSKISHKAQYYQLTLKISTKKEPLISQKSQILRFYVYSISPNCTILA